MREEAATAAAAAGWRQVVLVDDVFTTGATAGEVAGVISSGVALPVHVFTFSRATSSKEAGHD